MPQSDWLSVQLCAHRRGGDCWPICRLNIERGTAAAAGTCGEKNVCVCGTSGPGVSLLILHASKAVLVLGGTFKPCHFMFLSNDVSSARVADSCHLAKWHVLPSSETGVYESFSLLSLNPRPSPSLLSEPLPHHSQSTSFISMPF